MGYIHHDNDDVVDELYGLLYCAGVAYDEVWVHEQVIQKK